LWREKTQIKGRDSKSLRKRVAEEAALLLYTLGKKRSTNKLKEGLPQF